MSNLRIAFSAVPSGLARSGSSYPALKRGATVDCASGTRPNDRRFALRRILSCIRSLLRPGQCMDIPQKLLWTSVLCKLSVITDERS